MEISAILKSRRETLGLSLDDVAKMVGVNRSTIPECWVMMEAG